MDSSERMQNLIARFVLKYNYWGYLFSQIRRRPMTGFGSIMAVQAEPDGTLSLIFHPELVSKTTDEVLIKVIEHEGMHLLNKHLPRLIRILANETNNSMKIAKIDIWGVAADCTVNVQMQLEDNLIIAGESWPIQRPEKHNLPIDKLTEWYYLEFLKRAKFVKLKSSNGSGKSGGLDDHKGWTKGIEGIADLSSLARKIESNVQNIIREATKTFNKDRGKLPGHIASLIEGALQPPKAPYYQIIRKLVRGTKLSKFKRSPTKINKKRAYTFYLKRKDLPQIIPFPGKVRDLTFNAVILIDTSGSMDDESVKDGLSGVKSIIEADRHCLTTILEVDACVQKEYVVKKIRDIQFNIKGRKGTTLYPGLKRARELDCDVCLVFTDGFTEDVNSIPRKLLPKKLIWVITKNGVADQVKSTGWVVHIN